MINMLNIVLLIILIIIIYSDKVTLNKPDNLIKKDDIKIIPSQMLNDSINIKKELSNLLLPENSTNNITNQIGGSKAFKNVVLNDNNLKINNIDYKNYSSYRKIPSYVTPLNK
jgi:hypothetical protein